MATPIHRLLSTVFGTYSDVLPDDTVPTNHGVLPQEESGLDIPGPNSDPHTQYQTNRESHPVHTSRDSVPCSQHDQDPGAGEMPEGTTEPHTFSHITKSTSLGFPSGRHHPPKLHHPTKGTLPEEARAKLVAKGTAHSSPSPKPDMGHNDNSTATVGTATIGPTVLSKTHMTLDPYITGLSRAPEETPILLPTVATQESTDGPGHPNEQESRIALTNQRIHIDKLCQKIKLLDKLHDEIKPSNEGEIQLVKFQSNWPTVKATIINNPLFDTLAESTLERCLTPLTALLTDHHLKIKQHTFQLIQQWYETKHTLTLQHPYKNSELVTTVLNESLTNLMTFLSHRFQKELVNKPPNKTITTHTHTDTCTNTTTNDTHTITNTTTKPTFKTKNRPSKINRQSHAHDKTTCSNADCFTCAKDNIVNLSNITLTRPQITALSKGLSFIPTAKEISPRELIKNVDDFAQHTRTQYLRFQKSTQHSKRKRDLRFFRKPKHNDKKPFNTKLGLNPLEDTFHRIKCEIAELNHNSIPPKHNLTRKEHLALKELTENHDIICKRADKGSTITVVHKSDYIREGMEHLSDTNTYLPLDGDYTLVVAKIIRNTLTQLLKEGLLTAEMAEFCSPPTNPRPAQLYFLKKIHKPTLDVRPIVSSVNSATENLAEFLDIFLQPIMRKLPAYIKDTTELLQEVKKIKIQPNDWLVTVDVKSLYTNIDNEDGIRACYQAWLTQDDDPQQPPAEVLKYLLELVLKLNTLEFNEKFYLQTRGTAMGSKAAPAYANTFMGYLENTILQTANIKPLLYKRFIDDVLLIARCTQDELEEFLSHMNRANPTIKFTHEKSQTSITFLDVTLYKKDDSPTLQYKTHIKATNKQLYVKYNSHHPPGTFKGIITGEAIRYQRTNSERHNLNKMLLAHKRKLLKRGYPKNIINHQLKKIKLTHKSPNTLTQNNDCRPIFKTRYATNAKKAFHIVRKHWSLMTTTNPVLKKFITTKPRCSYTTNTSIARKLVRAKLRQPKYHSTNIEVKESSHNNRTAIKNLAQLRHSDYKEKTTTSLCNHQYCPVHPKLIPTNRVKSKTSSRTYTTNVNNANCNTRHVVYLIQCSNCKHQYVGQTFNSIKRRLVQHLANIKNKKATPLYEHFQPHVCGTERNVQIQNTRYSPSR